MSKVQLPNINERFRTGISIFLYTAVTIFFAAFADPRTMLGCGWITFIPSNIGRYVSFSSALILISMYGWMAYYIAKELNNVFLRSQKKIDLIILTTSLYLIQVVPTIIFILPTYNIAYFMLKEHPITLSYIYVGSSVFLPIIFYFVYRHMIKKSNNNTKFNVIVFPLLVIAIGLSFASLYYLAIIRYWTTIFILICAVFINDMFGYLGGSLFGKHKLAPHVSPKKTYAGFISAIIGATLFIVLTMIVFNHINGVPYKDYDTPQSAFLGQQLPESLWNFTNSPGWWAILVVIAIMYSLVSNAGDLLFSWIKRKNNIKDFSSILKGHGGLLDRLDSLTISIAIFGFITVIIAFICSYLTHNSNCIFPLFTSQ